MQHALRGWETGQTLDQALASLVLGSLRLPRGSPPVPLVSHIAPSPSPTREMAWLKGLLQDKV